MELLYTENIHSEIQINAEYYYFIINYIIGQKVNIHSNIGFYFHVVKNINKFREYEYLECFENFILQHSTKMSSEVLEILKSKDEFVQGYRSVKKLRSKRNISKIEKDLLITADAYINYYKTTVFDTSKKNLTELNLIEYLDLIDNDNIKINYTKHNRDLSLKDKEIGEIIFNNIKNKEKLIVHGTIINERNRLTQPTIKNDDQDKKGVIFTMTVLPILSIPCSKELTKESLIILRNQFQTKFDLLLSKIQEFRLKITNNENIEEHKEYLDDFKDFVGVEQESLQLEIDNHIYFKKIKNSDTDCLNINMCIGIAPIKFILTIYESCNTISFEKRMELENRVDNEIGENMKEVFIFYEIESEINKEENADE